MNFLFNFATRSRPEKFFRGIKSITDNLSGNHTYRIVVAIDEDDETMVNDEVLNKMRNIDNLFYYVGKSKNKIDAINREVCHFGDEWDVLVNMSDDMVFTKEGFDQDIVDDVEATLRDKGTTDFYLHYRDVNHPRADALCTLAIMGKDYFERDHYIYHPSFESVYCDNLQMDLAKARNKYYFFNKVIFEHLHCAYGKSERDEQYKKTEDRAVYRRDRKRYEKLKRQIKNML